MPLQYVHSLPQGQALYYDPETRTYTQAAYASQFDSSLQMSSVPYSEYEANREQRQAIALENIRSAQAQGTLKEQLPPRVTGIEAAKAAEVRTAEERKAYPQPSSVELYKQAERRAAEIQREQLTPEEQAGAKRLLESRTATFATPEARQLLYEIASKRDKTIKPATEYLPYASESVYTPEDARRAMDIKSFKSLAGLDIKYSGFPTEEEQIKAHTFYVQDASRVIDKYIYDPTAGHEFKQYGIFGGKTIRAEPGKLYTRDIFGITRVSEPSKTLAQARLISTNEERIVKTLETGALLLSPPGVFTSAAVLKGARVTMPAVKIPELKGMKEFIKSEEAALPAKKRTKTLTQLLERPKAETDVKMEVIDLTTMDRMSQGTIQTAKAKITKVESYYRGETKYEESLRLAKTKPLTSVQKTTITQIEKITGKPYAEVRGVELMQATKAIQKSIAKQSTKQIQKSLNIPISISKAGTKQKTKSVSAQIQKAISVQIPKEMVITAQKPLSKQKERYAVVLKPISTTKIKGLEGQYPILKPISLTTTKTQDRITERIRDLIRIKRPERPKSPDKPIRKPPVIKIPSLDLPDMEMGKKKGKKRKKGIMMEIKNPFITLKDI